MARTVTSTRSSKAKKPTGANKTTKPSRTTTKATTVKAASVVKSPTWWISLRSRVFDERQLPVGAVLAEFVGTFIFAAVILAASGQPLVILFALAAIVLIIGQLSGAHVNPAITVAAWVTRQVSGLRALGYVFAQMLGGALAFVVMDTLFNANFGDSQQQAAALGQQAQLFQLQGLTEGKEWVAFWSEVLGATIFGLGVGSAFQMKKEQFAAAYTVSGTFFVALLIGGQAAILNPAVALAAGAFTVDTLSMIWQPFGVWIVGTILGTTLGMGLFQLLRTNVLNKQV